MRDAVREVLLVLRLALLVLRLALPLLRLARLVEPAGLRRVVVLLRLVVERRWALEEVVAIAVLSLRVSSYLSNMCLYTDRVPRVTARHMKNS